MNQKSNTLYHLLKDEVQARLGRKIIYSKDCKELAGLIRVKTKRHISVSTLKRFFGIIQSNFSASKYTLDTLAIFLDFNTWQEFIHYFEKEKHKFSENSSWENLKKRTEEITNKSLQSLKNQVGSRIQNYPYRLFADKKLSGFLASPKTATAFVAPDGYGKTPIVIQLSEKFFTGSNALYPNDILCLIDGSILYNLITLNQKINRVYNLLEFDPKNSFSAPFCENPELIEGRFILIIDGVDDIYPTDGKTMLFIENLLKIISSQETFNWIKILITCTPRIWKMITEQIKKKHILKSFWYDVEFEGAETDFINIPLLKEKEIEKILKKNRFKYTLNELCVHSPGILDIIRNPYMLHLFTISEKTNEKVDEIDLLHEFIKKTILSPPYAFEKSEIIRTFFHLCNNGQKNTFVLKKDLHLTTSGQLAYTDLLRLGFFYEHTVVDEYLTLNTFVKFSHNELFAFYLANLIIKEDKFDIVFLKHVISCYDNSPHLGQTIMNYMVKILFKEEKIEVLRNIFSYFDKEELLKNPALEKIYSRI